MLKIRSGPRGSGYISQSIMNSNAGFSLIEIMVAVGLLGAGLFVVSSILISSTQDNVAAVERNAADVSLMTAELYLRNYLGQSVNTIYTNANLDGQNGGSNGLLRTYDSATGPVTPATLAVFNREIGGVLSDPANPASLRISAFEGDAMYFIPPAPPSGASPSTTGVLFFNTAKAGVINADYSGQFIPDIVEFSIKNPQGFRGPANPGDVLTSIDTRFVIRYFEPGKNAKMWCPNPAPTYSFNSSACASAPRRTFHDVEKTITIKFRNNAIPDPLGDATPQRILGGIYFFPMHISR